MRITGKINEWKIDKDEDEEESEDRSTFSVSTDFGDFYKIDATELDESNLDEIIKAMKDQRPVIFTDEMIPTVNGLDFTGYDEGTDIYGRWTVKEIKERVVSRSFLLRIWDGEPPEGMINIHVPKDHAELARHYIAVSLLYGDLYRKVEALAHGEGTDTREELKETIDSHNRLMEGRE